MRVVTSKHCSETYQSLDEFGVEYLLNLNEYLDTLDYLEMTRNECEADALAAQREAQNSRR